MPWRPRNLLKAWRLPPTRAATCLSGSRSWCPSKPYKIPSLHAILIPGCECHHTDDCLNEFIEGMEPTNGLEPLTC